MRTTCETIFAVLLVALSAHGAFDVRDIRFSNVHAKSLEHPLISGRPGNPLRRFVVTNCSFKKVTDAELPGWSRHGPAVWGRVRQTTFEHVEGFTYNNTRFDAP